MMNSGAIKGEIVGVMGGPWNYMNAIAGILNIITITGWFGITIRKETEKYKSRDMIWPDMLWFWIIAYDVWNFVYTYNCIPTDSWYAGFALLLVPTTLCLYCWKGSLATAQSSNLSDMVYVCSNFSKFSGYRNIGS